MHEDNNKQKKKERKLGHGGAKWLLKCIHQRCALLPIIGKVYPMSAGNNFRFSAGVAGKWKGEVF